MTCIALSHVISGVNGMVWPYEPLDLRGVQLRNEL